MAGTPLSTHPDAKSGYTDCSSSARRGPTDYFIRLRVRYEPEATGCQRSLSALMPELAPARLGVIEDSMDFREWAGVIDHQTYVRFAQVWLRSRDCGSYTFDGLEWEHEEWSPVVWAKVTVTPRPGLTRSRD